MAMAEICSYIVTPQHIMHNGVAKRAVRQDFTTPWQGMQQQSASKEVMGVGRVVLGGGGGGGGWAGKQASRVVSKWAEVSFSEC